MPAEQLPSMIFFRQYKGFTNHSNTGGGIGLPSIIFIPLRKIDIDKIAQVFFSYKLGRGTNITIKKKRRRELLRKVFLFEPVNYLNDLICSDKKEILN